MDSPFLLFVSVIAAFCLSAVTGSTVPHLSVLGQNITFTCRLDSNVRHIAWTHEEDVMATYRRDNSLKSFFKVSSNEILEINFIQLQAKLSILHVNYNNSGNYLCEQFREEGTSTVSRYRLQVQGYPRVSIETKTSTDNYIVFAKCCLGFSLHEKEILMIWFLQGTIIKRGISKPPLQRDGFVDFCDQVDIKTSHNIYGKILTCLIKNEHNLSSSIQMNVKYPATVDILESASVIIGKDDELVILCHSNGNPPPEPKLEREIGSLWGIIPINPNVHSNFSTYNITWEFRLGKTYDSVDGIYRCMAFNGIGKPSFSEKVTVVYEPSTKIEFLAVLVFPLAVITVILIRKLYKKSRFHRYEPYWDVPRRYTRRVSDTLRTLARSFRSFDNSSNLPDVCYNNPTAGEKTTSGQIAEILQKNDTLNATMISSKESDNVYFRDVLKGDSVQERTHEEEPPYNLVGLTDTCKENSVIDGEQEEEEEDTPYNHQESTDICKEESAPERQQGQEFQYNRQENGDERISQLYVNYSVFQKNRPSNANERKASTNEDKDNPLFTGDGEGKVRPTSGTFPLYAVLNKTENMEQFTTM